MDVSKIGTQTFLSASVKRNTVQEKNKATSQVKQDNDASGVEINISQEGRARQSAKQPKLTIDDSLLGGMNIGGLKSAFNGNGISRDNFTEFTAQSLEVNRSNGLLIMPDDSIQEVYRKELLNATTLTGLVSDVLDTGGQLSSVASKYMELRKKAEEKYSGDELAEHIKWLDDSYDNAIETIGRTISFGIQSTANLYELSARVNNDLVERGQTSGHTYDIPVKKKVEYDKDAIAKTIKILTQNIMNSMKQFGALAKQYMLDGNTAPVTDEEKSSFLTYISQGVDENDSVYSLDTLDMLKSIFDPVGGNNKKTTMYTALEKLENSGIANDLKADIIRITTQGDRMFGNIPEGFEEVENNLYESMKKWQKTL